MSAAQAIRITPSGLASCRPQGAFFSSAITAPSTSIHPRLPVLNSLADITARLIELVPAGRRLVFLEGGYDLQALADSTAACLGALAGLEHHPERPTSGGPGAPIVAAVRQMRSRVT